MAVHPFWRGYLKLSLVTCAVAMVPATTEAERVRFHTINRATGNRVVSRYVDAVSGKPVDETDQAKAYRRDEDDYVILEEDEIDDVALDSARTIEIDLFTRHDRIAWIWYDKPHFLTPGDKLGTEAFAVIRDAMAATGMVGIARLVLYRRERAVMLVPSGQGIILWTLRYGEEVRPEAVYFAEIDTATPDAKPLALIRKLIDARSTAWSEDFVNDPVQERLHEIIAAREKGRKRAPKPKAAPEPAGNVVNIMDALRQSMKAETSERSRKR